MSVVGYPTPGKEKAKLLLDAFCLPAGGTVVNRIPDFLLPGAAAFYGVTPATRHLFQQARREGRDFYYLDNAYFDSARQVYFRITKNRLQHDGRGASDGVRFAALKVPVRRWRDAGEHVLICPQSDEFMALCAEYPGVWLEDTLRDLRAVTTRELRVRPWNRDKKKWYASLPKDLDRCHALVTYSSAAAITAMLSGVPAFCTAEDCVARPAAWQPIQEIETPRIDVDRCALANVAADNQWTVPEMRAGLPWEKL